MTTNNWYSRLRSLRKVMQQIPHKSKRMGMVQATLGRAAFVVGCVLASAGAQAQTIDTVMGGGTVVNATDFALISPYATVTDASGNLFVSTGRFDQAVRKLDKASGTVSLIAGAAGPAYGGDGAPAVTASLNSPARMVYDVAGNLYIADSSNNRVRKIDTQGIITTFAGPAMPVGASQPTVVVTLNTPSSLSFDGAGNLYVGNSDSSALSVIKIAADKTVTTVASKTTTTAMKSIGDIVVDASGNLYVADWNNYCVHRFAAGTGAQTTFAGICGSYNGDTGTNVLKVDTTQAATAIKLAFPNSLTIDGAGNLYLSDQQLYRIWKIDPGSNLMSVVAGAGNQLPTDWGMPYSGEFKGDGGSAWGARFNGIAKITYDTLRNDLYVVDALNYRVRKIGSNGIINTVLGSGASSSNVPATTTGAQAQLNKPTALTFDAAGNLYVSDAGNGRVRMLAASATTQLVDAANTVTNTIATANPTGLAFDASGTLLVGDQNKNQIFKLPKGATSLSQFAGTGLLGSSGDGAAATLATLRNPQGMAVDSKGNVFFSDWQNHTIRKVTPAGIISTVVGLGWTGGFVDGVGSAARLVFPVGLTFDAKGNLYIADSVNNRVRKVLLGSDSEITANSIVTTIAGNGAMAFSGDNGLATNASLYWPNSVAVDSLGNVYIVDSGNARVRMVSAVTGVITTIAGGGTNGLGDGGPATAAQLMNPQWGVLDRQGNLLVSDLAAGRVRKITFATPDAPTGSAVAGDAMATVQFTAPVNMGGGSATRFTVMYTDPSHTTPMPGCDVAAFDASGAPVTSCDVTGLTNGTPYTFTVTVTNSLAKTSAPSTPIGPVTPWPALVLTAPGPQSAQVGTAFSLLVAATGGSQDFNYTVLSGAPPPGLTLGPNNGQITGTPTQAGSYTVTVQVQDRQTGNKQSATLSFSVGKGVQGLRILSTPPSPAPLGGNYTLSIQPGGSTVAPTILATGACDITAGVVHFLNSGVCTITVSQKGDAYYLDANDQIQMFQVAQASTGVVISSTPNPSTPGQEVLFSIAVAIDNTKSAKQSLAKATPVPTGTVTLTDTSVSPATALGTATLDASGNATLTVKSLTTEGAHNIVATYDGDGNYQRMQSASYTQTVAVAVAATTATPVPLFSEWWEKLILSAVLLWCAAMLTRGQWRR